MQKCANMSNNIKHIPKELNYFYNLNTRVKTLKKQGNISRFLIIILLLWNIGLTINQQTAINKAPKTNVKIIEQGEITDIPALPELPVIY